MELAFIHGQQYENADATFAIKFTGIRMGSKQYLAEVTVNGENHTGSYVIDLDKDSNDEFVIKVKYGNEPSKRLDIHCAGANDLEDKISIYSDFGIDHFILK